MRKITIDEDYYLFGFNLLGHLRWKGENLNEIGIILIALNKFLTSYLDTDEPFPPTRNFIEAVKNDVSKHKDLYGYSPAPPKHYPVDVHFSLMMFDEDLIYNVPKGQPYNVLAKVQFENCEQYEEYEEPTWHEVANLQISELSNRALEAIGLSYKNSVTLRKISTINKNLIEYAVACFFYANTCFHMLTFFDSNGPPACKQGGINSFSDPLPGDWEEILDAADYCLQNSGYKIGYCQREIEILRVQKKRMQESNKKKNQKYAEIKQRTIEIYNTIDNRSEMLAFHPYILAGKIRNKLMADGLANKELAPNKKKPDQKPQKRMKPRRDTIIRWLREETST